MTTTLIDNKICCVCKNSLPSTEFNSDKNRKDGKHPQCKECQRQSGRSWYNKHKARVQTKRDSNREEIRIRDRAYYKANRERIISSKKKYAIKYRFKNRQYALKTRYKLTEYQLVSMIEQQNFTCANPFCDITLNIVNFNVDHDHSCCDKIITCGSCVRGVLCGRCNTALGLLNDDPLLLEGAIIYLSKYKSKVKLGMN